MLDSSLGMQGLDSVELSALFELMGEQLLLVKQERWHRREPHTLQRLPHFY